MTRSPSALLRLVDVFPMFLLTRPPLHRLHRTQRFPVALEEAWDFFADPYKLARITPRWLDFTLTNRPRVPMTEGTRIRYRIRPVGPVPVRWETEITRVQRPALFVDVQRAGPYRLWHHQHLLRPVRGGVEVTDKVHYMLPLDLPGEPVHRWVVRPRLELIFAYRQAALERELGRWRG